MLTHFKVLPHLIDEELDVAEFEGSNRGWRDFDGGLVDEDYLAHHSDEVTLGDLHRVPKEDAVALLLGVGLGGEVLLEFR